MSVVTRLSLFVRLSCVYIRSRNLRFLRIQVSPKTGTMASISEGISSYIIIQFWSINSFIIFSVSLASNNDFFHLLTFVFLSTAFHVQPGEVNPYWEPPPLPKGTFFCWLKKYISLSEFQVFVRICWSKTLAILRGTINTSYKKIMNRGNK